MSDLISREEAIEALKTVAGVGNRALDKLRSLPAAQRTTFDGVTLYRCDPEKNVSCKKTGCYVNGGPCFMTSKKEYSEMEAIRRGDGLSPIPGYESDGSGFRKWP